MTSFMGLWIHSASLTRAMWLIGLLFGTCAILLIALIAILLRGRRRNFALRPLAPAR